jgi:arylsulfatase A-like enzyme
MRLRPWLALTLLGGLVAPLASPHPAGGTPPGARPNILIIVTDDQRLGTLVVMPQTKHWLRDRGVRFTEGYVSTPLCCPSRASIFTGRYAHNHEVRTNGDAGLLDQASTVQRYLHDGGYATAFAGKFLNLWDLNVTPPNFDHWALFSPPLYGPGYHDAVFNVNGKIRTVSYSTRFIGNKALQFLHDFEEQDDAKPWFLYVAPWAPHSPFHPEERYKKTPVPSWEGNPGTQEVDLSDKPPWVQEDNGDLDSGQRIRRKQMRTLMSVDDMVGELMGTLGQLDERQDTLVIFVSDNGYLWGEHGYTSKAIPYPEAVDVPLFMRWPGQLGAGTAIRRPVANVDIAPTILDAAGIVPDPAFPMDGRSVFDAHIRQTRFLEHWGATGPIPTWASIRTEDLQYVEYYDAAGELIFREYYDLRSDPWLLENLLGDGDTTNDPPALELQQLSQEVERGGTCQGTEGPEACP